MHVAENFDRARYFIDLALNEHAHISYSQFGEDRLIDVLFHDKISPGFYVDIGAHHPQRMSNTYLLYKKGWRGINVDGDPALIEAFEVLRPKDVNVSAFVSNCVERVIFSRFSESAVNTISSEKAGIYAHHWSVISQTETVTRTMREILEENLCAGQEIDLLTVDTEGVDLQVLQGNAWDRFRPLHIIVEVEGLDLMDSRSHPVVAFMEKQRYRLSGLIHVSAFFTRIE